MRPTSIIAIYTLFWSLSFFLVLPFRLQSRAGAQPPHDEPPHDEPPRDEPVPGAMPGAPTRFSFGRTAGWTTLVAIVLFGLYYLNYVEGWLPVEQIDFLSRRVYDDPR